MGNCFSSKKQGQVLGSGPPSAGHSAGASAPSVGGTPVSPTGNTIGGSGNPDDPRAAALRAAEARAQAVSVKACCSLGREGAWSAAGRGGTDAICAGLQAQAGVHGAAPSPPNTDPAMRTPSLRSGVQGCPGMIQKHQAVANAQAGNRGVSPTNAKAGQLSQKLAMERRTSSSANVKGNPNERMMWN
ncbi:hypothetical protein A1Q2_07114 [Trichosporon asahii var. asahii CBS 8904]|uniref:Uncharacterized protein n=1 Tax=Trichosporon asahii var. asahii (strain CBS 8904) TaxID=1220162 RepID=K1WA18_TRIAC|nr:hypothetical protein A1Q2_07114 [Trichosporon asahii var. asahii CBS 8904]